MNLPPPLPPTIAWEGDEEGSLLLLDQTRLPHHREVLRLTTVEGVIDAIRRLCVRGAPAIGVAAAYGLVIAVRTARPLPQALFEVAREQAMRLAAARPTAVNLQWALDRCLHALHTTPTLPGLLAEARKTFAFEKRVGR